jgi:hypothetical protein
VIRNAVLHLENEQPLLSDLYRLPEPTDVGLLCTNIRTLNGKRPVFVDDMAAAFFFPYRIIRFIEIPTASLAEPVPGAPPGPALAADVPAEPESDLEIDEDFLRRVREI